MNEQEQLWLRKNLLSELVGQASCTLGRTALMKLAYLLQTLKGVPLGYDFRLYTYGPFDSDLLDDLGVVESLGMVKSQIVTFPKGSGYGYEFTPGPRRDLLQGRSRGALMDYQPAIRWALEKFGRNTAAELELISTIIYADREAARQGKPLSFAEFIRQVKEIKPHFSDQHIAARIDSLAGEGLLTSSCAQQHR
jgi:uncharacterized protein